MKHLYLLITLLFITALQANAQQDTVDMGAFYANDVYYNLTTGEEHTNPSNNWDLAFRTGSRTDGIFINSANNAGAPVTTRLFVYPNSDTTGWNSFDTAGRLSWIELHNTDTSWEYGAFNVSATGFPDFSWGVYNQVSKIIAGDSLYLLEINNGGTPVYKKLWIVNKNFGAWRFRFANVNGTNEVDMTFGGSNDNAKVFDYYSIINEAKVNREPDSLKNWDLLFTRYTTYIPGGGYYPVAGIFSNPNVSVAQVSNIDVNTYDPSTLQPSDYSTQRDVIGSDWKNYTGSWVIEDSTLYFVKSNSGALWQIEFISFDGSTNGRSIFNKTQLSPATGINPVAPVASFGVYPNPAATQINLVYENRENSEKNTLNIFDMTGKLVETHSLQSAPGFYTTPVSISHLPAGIYTIALENAGYILTQKLVKQ